MRVNAISKPQELTILRQLYSAHSTLPFFLATVITISGCHTVRPPPPPNSFVPDTVSLQRPNSTVHSNYDNSVNTNSQQLNSKQLNPSDNPLPNGAIAKPASTMSKAMNHKIAAPKKKITITRQLPAAEPHYEHDPSDSHSKNTAIGRPRPDKPEVVIAVPHQFYKRRREFLAPSAAEAYELLLAHARNAGFQAPLFSIVSGFRSDEVQEGLWRQALKEWGSADEARNWVAPPKHSKHRSGLAVDLYLGYFVSRRFVDKIRETKAYLWLRDNAAFFGFNPYSLEPWHWEYNAK